MMKRILSAVSLILCILFFFTDQLQAEKEDVMTDHKITGKNTAFTELEEFSKKESFTFHNSEDYQGKNIICFDGPLKIKGDLNLDQLENNTWLSFNSDNSVIGIWVKGDLQVEGTIVNLMEYGGNLLIVEGETQAENIIGGGAEILLRGGAKVTQIIFTPYSNGVLDIDDHLKAKVIFNDDDHYFSIPNTTEGLIVGFENTYEFEHRSFSRLDYKDIFLSEFLEIDKGEDEEYDEFVSVKIVGLLEAIVSRKQFLKKSLPTASKKWNSHLSEDTDYGGFFADFEEERLSNIPEAIVDNPQIFSLDLTDNKFKEFPDEIFSMKNLKYLDLSGNPISTLPDDAAELNLEIFLFYDSTQLSLKDIVEFFFKNAEIEDIRV